MDQGSPAGKDGEYRPTTRPPQFKPLEIDVDWRVLPKKLLFDIMAVPDEQAEIQAHLSHVQEYEYDPPDHPEYFWARRGKYAELGLRVSQIAHDLRKHAGMSVEKPEPQDWTRDHSLKQVIEDVEAAKEKKRKRLAEARARNPEDFA
jgi:hypothetical protein